MTTATSSDLVISPGLYDATTEYIELLPIVTADGTNNLSLANSILTNVVTESNAVPANVKVGQNFFYGIEQYNSSVGNLRQLLLSESGIGELIESDGGIFLKREHVFEQSLEDDFYTPITSESFLKFDEDSYVIITTYIPTDYIQLCAQKDAVLCTTEAFTPTPVELGENSILGRRTDSIESLDSSGIHDILGYASPIESVTAHTGSIILATSLLELVGSDSKIVSHQLHLRSRNTHPSTRTKGYLIFNDNKKAFEGYDGTKWRQLAWADETTQVNVEGFHWVIDGDTVVLYDANNNVVKTGDAVYGPRL